MLPVISIFSIGNDSRGDDALAIMLVKKIISKVNRNQFLATINIYQEYQLQVENVCDLVKVDWAIFIDAGVNLKADIIFEQIAADHTPQVSTHQLSPASLLSVYQRVYHQPPPPVFTLIIPGYSFKLGDNLSAQAENNLVKAESLLLELLKNPNLNYWQAKIKSIN